MSAIQVTIDQGSLKGKAATTINGFTYNSFKGIPYAKPPLGDLRFQDPQPADAWTGVYDATVEKNSNAQIDLIFTQAYEGSEDSLYVNVYVPQNKSSTESFPVMLWIHGGGFSMGSSSQSFYGPDYLVEKNVIVVTFNYRLGPLGYLCLNTKNNSGNAGMKDQVMALKWVKNNIEKFGGDPENITLFGESAGGASVHHHIVSPMSAGLFNKAILQSGTCMNDWAVQNNPEKVAFKLAEILGLKSTDKDEVIQHLRNIPVEDLVKASFHPDFIAAFEGNEVLFAPVIEKENLSSESFLSKCPKEIMKSGSYNKVPTIIGFTSKEGVLLYHKVVSTIGASSPSLDTLIPDFQNFLSPEIKSFLGPDKCQIVADRIKQFYFPTEDNVMEDYVDFISDVAFVKDINLSLQLLSKFSPPAYYYRFIYSGTFNVFKYICKFKYTGAAHSDELGYLFKSSMPQVADVVPTSTDISVINSMSEMWTNFAKFGNPTPKVSENIPVIWKPATEEDLHCLEIDETNTLIQNPHAERLQFWETLGKI